MRRRALHLLRGAGLAMPTVLALSGTAEAAPAAGKEQRASEAATPAARLSPTPGDVAPADPVEAAFGLFPKVRRETRDEAASAGGPDGGASAARQPLPAPPEMNEVAPGVVEAARSEPAPPVPQISAYAPLEPPSLGFEKVLEAPPHPLEVTFSPTQATPAPIVLGPRPFAVPLPRRRPAAPKTGTPYEVASLSQAEAVAVGAAPVDPAPIAAEGIAFGEPKKIPKEALPYLAILRREAAANKVPLWLAVGVGWVESKYNPKLRGTHGVVGLMQVMPSTARFQGYRGPTEKLLDPETNIVWGLRELGWDWAKAGGNPCLAIAKYKGGIATKGIPSAAVDYCHKAKKVTGML